MKILYTSSSIDLTTEKMHFLELVLDLRALGHDLQLLVSRYVPSENENYGLDIVFIPTGRRSFKSYLRAEFLRFFYLPLLLARFRPHVIYGRKERFDFAPPFWACLFRVPYVVEVNGILEEELRMNGYSERFISIVGLIEAMNYKGASRVVCVTNGIKHGLLKRFGVEESKLAVVPNGANIDMFKPLNKMLDFGQITGRAKFRLAF